MPSSAPIPGARAFVFKCCNGFVQRPCAVQSPLTIRPNPLGHIRGAQAGCAASYATESYDKISFQRRKPKSLKWLRPRPASVLSNAIRKSRPDILDLFAHEPHSKPNLAYRNPYKQGEIARDGKQQGHDRQLSTAVPQIGRERLSANGDAPWNLMGFPIKSSPSDSFTKRCGGDVIPGKLMQRAGSFSDVEGVVHEFTPKQQQARLEFPSLPSITARVIELANTRTLSVSASTDRLQADAASKSLAPSELAYLKAQGYTVKDVERWASILCELRPEKTLRAISHGLYSRLDLSRETSEFQNKRIQDEGVQEAHSHHEDIQEESIRGSPTLENTSSHSSLPHSMVDLSDLNSIIPLFVILYVLKRKRITGESLSYLLDISWYTLRHSNRATFEDNQITLLFKRLLRHARLVYPEGIVNITSILTTFVPGYLGKDGMSQETYTRMIKVYNEALHLISLPTMKRPFISYSLQETAQFNLLGRMARFTPPLKITGVGFRAAIRVQLTHKKTEQERDWTELKSRSWPPWRVSRTRMDEDKGFDYGISRAHRTLQWMRLAGYAFPEWEQVARIFAGWDTDGTPTIQTRKILPNFESDNIQKMEARLWQARIQATRTSREAWACFLSYEDAQLPEHSSVYKAMFEKLYMESRRTGSDAPLTNGILPGDGKETFPPPTSPMESIYLKSEPPGFKEFFQRMIGRGIRPFDDFLGKLLAWSPDIETALYVWKECKGLPLDITTISSHGEPRMTGREFEGLIQVCCRFPSSEQATLLFHDEHLWALAAELKGPAGLAWHRRVERFAVFHAFYLAVLTRSQQPSVWNNILTGINAIAAPKYVFLFYDCVLHILETMQRLSVPLDGAGFSIYCEYAQRAFMSARRNMDSLDWPPTNRQATPSSHILNTQEPKTLLRRKFYELVGPDTDKKRLSSSGIPPIPRLLHTPSPHECHAYLRALGALHDYESIVRFAKWIATNEAELQWLVDEEMGGRRRWRRLLVGFRVYIEASEAVFPGEMAGPNVNEEVITLVRRTLEGMKSLGGWASDEEVEEYNANSTDFPKRD